MTELLTLNGFFSLFTLIILEISLGIDNIIFISMFVARVDSEMQDKVRAIGLSLALILRILMLFSLTWIISLDSNPVHLFGWELTIKDMILIGGGLFLIFKTTREIHAKFDSEEKEEGSNSRQVGGFMSIITNIILIDFIFSFDSILTAIGLTRNILIMVIAVVIAMIIMFFFSKAINHFLDKHLTFQMLALAFLVMIGFVLMLEGFGQHVPKGYIYFSMLFSFSVELLNMRAKNKSKEDQKDTG